MEGLYLIDIDLFYIDLFQLGGFQPSPKGYAPTLAWQKMQVKDFSEVRNVSTIFI